MSKFKIVDKREFVVYYVTRKKRASDTYSSIAPSHGGYGVCVCLGGVSYGVSQIVQVLSLMLGAGKLGWFPEKT